MHNRYQPDPDRPAFTSWPLPVNCPDNLHVLYYWQDGRCALCGFPDRLVMDHDHDTGLKRGLLCRSCNNVEGKGGGGPDFDAWRAGTTPCAALEIREAYTDIFGNTPMRREITEAELDALANIDFSA